MPVHAYLVVEGQADVEFVAALLRCEELHRVQDVKDLDSYWRPLVPTAFPYKDDLSRRVPVPLFLASPTHSVAVHSALGDSQLATRLTDSLAVLDTDQLQAIGVILDSDATSPADRFQAVTQRLSGAPFAFPDSPGTVSQGNPRAGVFVLPDNQAYGTLEDVLLDCAREVYPTLLEGATGFVDGADVSGLDDRDKQEFSKPAGANKAKVGAVASVLKPCKSIQTSIHDNRWVSPATLGLNRVQTLRRFLLDLLRLGAQEDA